MNRTVRANRLTDASDIGRRAASLSMAEEVPLSVTYNGVAHVVMMITPQDVEDFVIGFSMTEGLLSSASEIESFDVRHVEGGLLADTWISKENYKKIEARRRNLPGQTSCGICGVIELEAALPTLEPLGACPEISSRSIHKAVAGLEHHQPLQDRTRSVHVAAFANLDGEIALAREDIGRHNALDKLIGALARGQIDCSSGFVLMSSRCSVELVQKMVRARIPVLATLSAPTTLAVDIAQGARLTLLTRVREDRLDVVSDPFSRFDA